MQEAMKALGEDEEIKNIHDPEYETKPKQSETKSLVEEVKDTEMSKESKEEVNEDAMEEID